MKKIWIKYKLILIVAGYILAGGSLLYFLAVPLVRGIENASDEAQKKIIDRQMEQSRAELLPQMETHRLAFESKKDSLEVIMSVENEVGFIEDIELIAGKTGNVISLNIGDDIDPKEIAKLKKTAKKKDESRKSILDEISYANYFPLKINLKGSYADLINFIRMLESSRFYVNIISVNSQKEAIDDKSGEAVRNDIFSKKSDEAKEENSKKEIIDTDINAIVYTKN